MNLFKHDELEHNTGLVEAIIFYKKYRDKIRGNPYARATTLCYTSDLSKLEGYK